jgi:ABC-type Fe3+-siderophore transport system permease subunit
MKKDEYKLLGYGLLTALLMGLVLTPILARDVNFPKVAAEGILGIIAGAVFLLYKYIERRKNSN